LSDRELFLRHPANPILTADAWPYPVNVVFNPAAAQVGDETVILARVEDLRGLSHLAVARSPNGIDGWSIDEQPLLSPADGVESEKWGFEDARVVFVPDLDSWTITCTAYGPAGPAVYLATTRDFREVERYGIIQHPEDKNAALLPEQIDGMWVLFHRPQSGLAAGRGGIFVSRSPDLSSWTAPEQVLQPRTGAWWDSLRIGIGPPPLRTEHGWLLIYHGVKETVSGNIYRVGLALTDLDEPTRVLKRLPGWILSPRTDYERIGDVPNVVFPCGAIHDPETDDVRLYYGAADTSVCLATAKLSDVLAAVLDAPD
jgi:beta-1,2-mannobiose phosphorylase / 1,2-beta-oligomannan phosphorylase